MRAAGRWAQPGRGPLASEALGADPTQCWEGGFLDRVSRTTRLGFPWLGVFARFALKWPGSHTTLGQRQSSTVAGLESWPTSAKEAAHHLGLFARGSLLVPGLLPCCAQGRLAIVGPWLTQHPQMAALQSLFLSLALPVLRGFPFLLMQDWARALRGSPDPSRAPSDCQTGGGSPHPSSLFAPPPLSPHHGFCFLPCRSLL